MHVGMCSIFQASFGTLSDHEVMQADLRLADLAEPLGFESIWGVEHHFTEYTMAPDVLQYLTYMAGRTSHVKLGSMVLVLPWHDPVRAAEQILLLDHMSEGRLILGLGRGTGRCEFDGLRVPMESARGRFGAMAEAIMGALETGVMSYDGPFLEQPKVELRPGPFKSFEGRIYSATVSPESAEIMARLGTGVLIIPQKPWNLIEADVEAYRQSYLQSIGTEPPGPIMSEWVFVDRDPGRAEELGRKFLGNYWASVVQHYEFDQPHLKSTPGYEFHGKIYDQLSAPGGMEKMTDFFIELHPYGTPEQVLEKIMDDTQRVGAGGFVGVFRFGGMTPEEGERNMRLFASDVMPTLQALNPTGARLESRLT